MENEKQLQDLTALVSRVNLATQLGLSYGGERDLYSALGYKKTLTFQDYYSQYERQEIATAIIDRPVNSTWRGNVLAIESGEAEKTEFEKKWFEIQKKFKSKLSIADKLTGIGQYSVMLLGFSDVYTINDFAKPVSGKKLELLYITPVSEQFATINEYESDNQSERFGQPKTYNITLSNTTNGEQTLVVDHTRVIHITENSIDDITGRPRLQPVFNRLKDIEKLSGGSAEMFWRGARPGYSAEVKKDYNLTQEAKDNLTNQFSEFENNLRRILATEGIDFKSIQQQIADPSSQIDVQIQLISAQTGIPKRVLTGSERGELSSGQDANEWATLIESRRELFCDAQILIPLIDRLMEYGVLPKIETYTIEWVSLHEASPKEKAEVGKIRAEALRAYTSTESGVYVIPPRAFYELGLGLNAEQIELLEAQQQEFSNEANGKQDV